MLLVHNHSPLYWAGAGLPQLLWILTPNNSQLPPYLEVCPFLNHQWNTSQLGSITEGHGDPKVDLMVGPTLWYNSCSRAPCGVWSKCNPSWDHILAKLVLIPFSFLIPFILKAFLQLITWTRMGVARFRKNKQTNKHMRCSVKFELQLKKV